MVGMLPKTGWLSRACFREPPPASIRRLDDGKAHAGNSPRRATHFLARQKVSKERPLQNRPPCGWVPCDARSPGPRPTHFATLRSNKGARSQMLKRATRSEEHTSELQSRF